MMLRILCKRIKPPVPIRGSGFSALLQHIPYALIYIFLPEGVAYGAVTDIDSALAFNRA